MDPRDLLLLMNQAYEQVSSYEDRGVVLTHWPSDEEPGQLLFRTWFVRPDRFRFDWRDHHPFPPLRHIVTNYSICLDGVTTRWWQDSPVESHTAESLGMAIAEATGISRSSACSIPNLLMPEVVGAFRFDQLERVRYVGTDLFEGTNCHCIGGDHPLGGEYRLWLGASDSLIRKIWTQHDSGHADQIHRDLQVNVAIPRDVFCGAGSLLGAV